MAHLVTAVMGTTVSIDVRDPALGQDVLAAAVGVLREVDARFSTYRDDSEIRRLERGVLTLADVHADVREVLAACAVLRAESNGAFDARMDGRLDPSGYVKGWAAERAADVLRAAGARSFCINLGGDVVCSGEASPGQPWRVGVRRPDDRKGIALVLGVRDGSVATSGAYERGDHVRHGSTGDIPRRWTSVTVLAPDLATADPIATAALAMGEHGPAWAARRPTCDVVAIDMEGRLWTSPGIEAARIA
jgi:thiamine biosynthesis lipoprotein